jgi:hypothetical protein
MGPVSETVENCVPAKKIDTSVVSLLIYNPQVRDILVKSVGPTVENSKDSDVNIFLNTANGSIS